MWYNPAHFFLLGQGWRPYPRSLISCSPCLLVRGSPFLYFLNEVYQGRVRMSRTIFNLFLNARERRFAVPPLFFYSCLCCCCQQSLAFGLGGISSNLHRGFLPENCKLFVAESFAFNSILFC